VLKEFAGLELSGARNSMEPCRGFIERCLFALLCCKPNEIPTLMTLGLDRNHDSKKFAAPRRTDGVSN
jgi:hypothetical protein